MSHGLSYTTGYLEPTANHGKQNSHDGKCPLCDWAPEASKCRQYRLKDFRAYLLSHGPASVEKAAAFEKGRKAARTARMAAYSTQQKGPDGEAAKSFMQRHLDRMEAFNTHAPQTVPTASPTKASTGASADRVGIKIRRRR